MTHCSRSHEAKLLVFTKSAEYYVFVYDDTNRQPILLALGRAAANPDLDFTWQDAADLTRLCAVPQPSRHMSSFEDQTNRCGGKILMR